MIQRAHTAPPFLFGSSVPVNERRSEYEPILALFSAFDQTSPETVGR